MKAHFITSLTCSPLDDGIHWRLTKPLKFVDSHGELHVVPTSFVSDFASVPPLSFIAGLVLCFTVPLLVGSAWMHWLTPLLWSGVLTAAAVWVAIVADKFNCDDSGASKLDAPSVIHDNGYHREHLGHWLSQIRMKQYWDGIMYQAMRANGVDAFTSNTVWFMLLLFGWFAYFNRKHL